MATFWPRLCYSRGTEAWSVEHSWEGCLGQIALAGVCVLYAARTAVPFHKGLQLVVLGESDLLGLYDHRLMCLFGRH
jgi:hypothetical protein